MLVRANEIGRALGSVEAFRRKTLRVFDHRQPLPEPRSGAFRRDHHGLDGNISRRQTRQPIFACSPNLPDIVAEVQKREFIAGLVEQPGRLSVPQQGRVRDRRAGRHRALESDLHPAC